MLFLHFRMIFPFFTTSHPLSPPKAEQKNNINNNNNDTNKEILYVH